MGLIRRTIDLASANVEQGGPRHSSPTTTWFEPGRGDPPREGGWVP